MCGAIHSLNPTYAGSFIFDLHTILDKKTLGRCFFMADDYVSWTLSSTKWLHPPPPGTMLLSQMSTKLYNSHARECSPTLYQGRGDGFLEDILEIVQHSLYLMCSSK